MNKILYLGSPTDFDTHTARLLWRFMRDQTGNRALLVVYPKGNA